MKRGIIIIGMGLIFTVALFAQPPVDNMDERREQIEAQRVAFITKHLNLTPEEAQAFWPVYNQYKEQKHEIHEEMRPVKPLDELSDAEVEELLDRMIERKEREVELEKEYLAKFRDILPVRKVAKLQVAERRFNAEVIRRLSEHVRERRKNIPKK